MRFASRTSRHPLLVRDNGSVVRPRRGNGHSVFFEHGAIHVLRAIWPRTPKDATTRQATSGSSDHPINTCSRHHTLPIPGREMCGFTRRGSGHSKYLAQLSLAETAVTLHWEYLDGPTLVGAL